MQQFAWIKEFYPSLFQAIKCKIKSGQFIPVGGTWIEMVRNCFHESYLNISSSVYMHIPCFLRRIEFFMCHWTVLYVCIAFSVVLYL